MDALGCPATPTRNIRLTPPDGLPRMAVALVEHARQGVRRDAVGLIMADLNPTNPTAVDDPSGLDAPVPKEVAPDGSLDCPACGTDLAATALWATHRVCGSCGRHFSLPARERLALLVDPGSFVETNAALISVDPLVFHSHGSSYDLLPAPDRLAGAQERAGLAGVAEGAITGVGAIGGQAAVLIVLDFAALGGSIGVIAGEKIALAMEQAVARRLPLIAMCAGGRGPTRAPEGMLSLVQVAKTASAATRLRRAGVPFVAVLTHPTTGGVYAGLANQADVILAEPGAQVGFDAAQEPVRAMMGGGTHPAEALVAHGMIDGVIARAQLRSTLATLLDLLVNRGALRAHDEPPPISVSSALPAWEAAELARHPTRPSARDYVRRLMPAFVELRGDRVAADDPGLIGGIGRLNGVTVALVAQERARTGPAGYRKAIRLARLAGQLEFPLITLVDTPGAAADATAEVGGIGVAIGQTLAALGRVPVPVVCVVIGEGGGAGALALAVGDRILMQQHAVFTIAGAEGGASSRPRPTATEGSEEPVGDRPGAYTLTARDCHRLGVVDVIVPEPDPAAHADPDAAARLLGDALGQTLRQLSGVGPRRLVEDRARKVRHLGQTTPEGKAATRREVRDLQELQRNLARSLGDLRERWEGWHWSVPRRPLAIPRPDLAEFAGRLATRRGGSIILHEVDRSQAPDKEDRDA